MVSTTQILYKMLKYEKVHERSRHRLKLKDIGYEGLIANLNDVPVSMLLFRCLLEQVLGSGTANMTRTQLHSTYLARGEHSDCVAHVGKETQTLSHLLGHIIH